MIGNFQGGASPDSARNNLRPLRFDSGWIENQKANPDDHRPRHDFLEMKGPYSDMGISGQLELTFYNDRLMAAQFIPTESERYFRILSERLGKLPAEPGKPKPISRVVSLTYYRDANGSVRFCWDFLPVSKEWNDWVSKYSSIVFPLSRRSS
jgi:hypothetical protein